MSNRRLLVLLVIPLAGVAAGYLARQQLRPPAKPKPGWVLSNFAYRTAPGSKLVMTVSFTLLPKGAPGAQIRLHGRWYPCTRLADRQDFRCRVPGMPLKLKPFDDLKITVKAQKR